MELLIDEQIITGHKTEKLKKTYKELIQEVIDCLINNGVPIPEIDNILVTAVKMSDRWKMREYLLTRQNRCQICGKGGELEMHHIKPQSSRPDLKYNLNNILLLCNDCHDVIHKNHIESKAPQVLKRILHNVKDEAPSHMEGK